MVLYYRNGTLASKASPTSDGNGISEILFQLHDEGKPLSNLDLRGRKVFGVFGRMNFDNVDFTDADLSNAWFERCELRDAIFDHSDCRKTTFENCNMRENSFSYMKATGSNWKESNLRGSKFYAATIDFASFEGADMRNTNFRNANLSNTSFKDARIAGMSSRMAIRCANEGLPMFLTEPQINYMYHTDDQPVYMYKLTNGDFGGVYHPTLEYKVGETYEVKNIDKLSNPGLAVATLEWLLREWISMGAPSEFHLFKVKFKASDILTHQSINDYFYQLDSDPKFSVRKFEVMEEIDLTQFRKHLKLN